MQHIDHVHREGERPFFALKNARITDSSIGPGESSFKHCSNLVLEGMEIDGKYPLWHCEHVHAHNCHFGVGARAAVWYSHDIAYENCRIDAPKMFRDTQKIALTHVELTDASEAFWHTRDVTFDDVSVDGGSYLFMHADNVHNENYRHQGNYAFQYCKNIEIHNARIQSRDAFWNSENITVVDSVIESEFLGWHSKNLKLVRCTISGPQPLCYAENLVMQDCTMADDSSLAFEYSTVEIDVQGTIPCVQNPLSGSITADRIDSIIFDEFARSVPEATRITVRAGK